MRIKCRFCFPTKSSILLFFLKNRSLGDLHRKREKRNPFLLTPPSPRPLAWALTTTAAWHQNVLHALIVVVSCNPQPRKKNLNSIQDRWIRTHAEDVKENRVSNWYLEDEQQQHPRIASLSKKGMTCAKEAKVLTTQWKKERNSSCLLVLVVLMIVVTPSKVALNGHPATWRACNVLWDGRQ